MAKNILVIANSHLPTGNSGSLTREGYKVDMVNNTEEDLALINTRDYDIVIIQVGPETNEWQLYEQIKQLATQPLIVISTHSSVGMATRAIEAGADYFLRKPFGPMELNARIRSLLQHRSVKIAVPAITRI